MSPATHFFRILVSKGSICQKRWFYPLCKNHGGEQGAFPKRAQSSKTLPTSMIEGVVFSRKGDGPFIILFFWAKHTVLALPFGCRELFCQKDRLGSHRLTTCKTNPTIFAGMTQTCQRCCSSALPQSKITCFVLAHVSGVVAMGRVSNCSARSSLLRAKQAHRGGRRARDALRQGLQPCLWHPRL